MNKSYAVTLSFCRATCVSSIPRYDLLCAGAVLLAQLKTSLRPGQASCCPVLARPAVSEHADNSSAAIDIVSEVCRVFCFFQSYEYFTTCFRTSRLLHKCSAVTEQSQHVPQTHYSPSTPHSGANLGPAMYETSDGSF